jgi:hypothetical protein
MPVRRTAVAAALIALITAPAAVPARAADRDDRAGGTWTTDFPDPFVLRDGATYYAYATITGAPGIPVQKIPVLRSTDLRTWTHVGDALAAPPSWSERRDLWAPGVARVGPHWALYYTAPHVASGKPCISVATASSPAGPFTDRTSAPLVCQTDLNGSIDPSPFVDTDGVPYLIWKSEGRTDGEETKLWAQRLTADGLGLTGARTVLARRDQEWERPLVENPAMVRHRGRYLLFYSSGLWNTAGYATGYAVCAAPLGPCTKPGNGPALATHGDVAGPGGPSPFIDTLGRLQLAFHAWTPPRVGYPAGGQRTLRTRRVRVAGSDVYVDGSPSPWRPFGTPDALVRQQYRDVLGREADAAGTAHWSGQLSSDVRSPAAVVGELLASPEFGGRVGPVVRLYLAAFDRLPDHAGLQYWLGQVRAGTSLRTVASVFAGSEEYRRRHGGPGDGDVLLWLTSSADHVARTAPDVTVTVAYVGMLRRTPDAAGFRWWRDAVRSAGAGPLLAGILGSPEYANRF